MEGLSHFGAELGSNTAAGKLFKMPVRKQGEISLSLSLRNSLCLCMKIDMIYPHMGDFGGVWYTVA